MTSSKETYSQGHHPSTTQSHARRTAEEDGGFVLPHLKPTFRILDVGCGPGTITASFAKYVPEGSVTGIDLNENVLEQARGNLSTLHPRPANVTFEIGNVLDGLKYADATFDVVYTSQVIVHIPDPVKALKEMKRVCKSGGMIACREADLPWHFYPELPGLMLWAKYFYDLTIVKTDLDQPMSLPHVSGHRGGSMLHVWAREAGFDPDKMMKSGVMTIHATKEDRKWFGEGIWGRIEQGGMGDKFKALGASDENVALIVKDWKAWQEDIDSWFAIMQVQDIFRV